MTTFTALSLFAFLIWQLLLRFASMTALTVLSVCFFNMTTLTVLSIFAFLILQISLHFPLCLFNMSKITALSPLTSVDEGIVVTDLWFSWEKCLGSWWLCRYHGGVRSQSPLKGSGSEASCWLMHIWMFWNEQCLRYHDKSCVLWRQGYSCRTTGSLLIETFNFYAATEYRIYMTTCQKVCKKRGQRYYK